MIWSPWGVFFLGCCCCCIPHPVFNTYVSLVIVLSTRPSIVLSTTTISQSPQMFLYGSPSPTMYGSLGPRLMMMSELIPVVIRYLSRRKILIDSHFPTPRPGQKPIRGSPRVESVCPHSREPREKDSRKVIIP